MKPRNLFTRCFPSLNDFAFLTPAILLFCMMGGVASMLGDGDTGWHIRAGEWILDHHRFPTADFFSFTKPGQPWFAWEWLWEVCFAWFHRQTGMAGVILGSVLALGLTSMFLLRLIRRRSKNNVIAVGVTVLAILGMSLHFLARPHLFSFLFTVILLDVLESRRESGKFPWILVPLFVVWANVHPGFAAGIIILAAWTAGELGNALAALEPGRRTELLARFRQYLLLTAICVLAPLVNPYGYRLYVHIFSFLSDSYALTYINEYKVVDFRSGPGRIFELMLFLGAPAAISRLLKRDFVVPALFLSWAHLAITAQRNIPFFMLVMAAPVAVWLEEMVAAFSRPPVSDAENPAVAIPEEEPFARFPLVSILTMVLIFVLLLRPGSPPKFEPQYDPSKYPAAAISAVRLMGPSARLFTTDSWGGYLIYRLPDVPVFWDGRADFYGTPYNLAALDAVMGRPGWNRTLVDNRITAVLMPVTKPLASLLAESRDWHTVYQDDVSVLFQQSPAGMTNPESGRLAAVAR